MKNYISAKYIDEKSKAIRNLLNIVDSADSDNLANKISESNIREITFAFAVIAKELGEQIPDV